MKTKRDVSLQGITVAILGLWLIVSTFVNFDSESKVLNNFIIGVTVAMIGYYIIRQKKWQCWLCMIMGVWMMISAFIPVFIIEKGYEYNNIISGIIIAMGGFGALGKWEETMYE